MIHTVPLKLDNIAVRAHTFIGIYELNGKIVFVHSILEDVPREHITENTKFPEHIVADFFSPDFSQHTQAHITYIERKTFYHSQAECRVDGDSLLMDTLHYELGGPFYQAEENKGLAKRLEIREGSIREIGEPPEPVEKVFNDNKTYRFGDYVVRMAAPFKMECTTLSTGSVVWELRLTAYLYTEIEERNGMLYFGTAGKGGRFYGLSLRDGQAAFAYDTGGTIHYDWFEGAVLVTDRKGDMVALNPEHGIELRRYDFHKLKLQACPYTLISGDNLYLLAQEKKEPFALHAAWVKLNKGITK